MQILALINGYKTYIAGVGLGCLAVYQITQGDLTGAYQSVIAALAAVGLRHAVEKAKS